MPRVALADGLPHSGIESTRMDARSNDAVVFPQQLMRCHAIDFTKQIIHIGDGSVDIRGTDNGVLIQGALAQQHGAVLHLKVIGNHTQLEQGLGGVLPIFNVQAQRLQHAVEHGLQVSQVVLHLPVLRMQMRLLLGGRDKLRQSVLNLRASSLGKAVQLCQCARRKLLCGHDPSGQVILIGHKRLFSKDM